MHNYSCNKSVRYSSCPRDEDIPQQNSVDKTNLIFGSKRKGQGTIFHSQTRKVKPNNRNAPNSVESAVSVKLHHMSSLITNVYAEEILDDIDTVLLAMTSRKQKKLQQSITEIFGNKLSQDQLPPSNAEIFGIEPPQEPLPQSITEIFGTNLPNEPLPKSIAEIFGY